MQGSSGRNFAEFGLLSAQLEGSGTWEYPGLRWGQIGKKKKIYGRVQCLEYFCIQRRFYFQMIWIPNKNASDACSLCLNYTYFPNCIITAEFATISVHNFGQLWLLLVHFSLTVKSRRFFSIPFAIFINEFTSFYS